MTERERESQREREERESQGERVGETMETCRAHRYPNADLFCFTVDYFANETMCRFSRPVQDDSCTLAATKVSIHSLPA